MLLLVTSVFLMLTITFVNSRKVKTTSRSFSWWN